VAYALRLGLSLVRIEAGALPYLSPPFEQNALGAQGLTGIPLTWRRGDLAVFACEGSSSESRPAPCPPESPWLEAVVQSVRIRFRQQRHDTFTDPQLRSIVEGDVLASVSRRHPIRSTADVWTSGNRVFACGAPSLLADVAAALSARQSPTAWAARHLGRQVRHHEARLLEHAAAQLEALVALESHELRRYASSGLVTSAK